MMPTITASRWMADLDAITEAYTQAFGHLPATELNRKPNAETWSIGQVIDHVIKVNETYWPVVAQLRAGTYRTPWTADVPFLVRWFGDFILKSVEPERRRKTKTFPVWEPAQSEVRADIVAHFAQHQQELAGLMQSCGDLLRAGTIISSPANRFIVYKLERAFDIMVAHERRHFNQAKEILVFFEKN